MTLDHTDSTPRWGAIPTLHTARLRVRRLEPGDLEPCHRLFRDIGWTDPQASEGSALAARRRWLDWTVRSYDELEALYQPPYGERAVELHDGAFVGLVGLVPAFGPFTQLPSRGARPGARYTPELGLFWAMVPQAQGRGYASEAAGALVDFAFAGLNAARVVATTEHANLASIGVMRRLGMRVEANPFEEPRHFQTVGVLDAPAG